MRIACPDGHKWRCRGSGEMPFSSALLSVSSPHPAHRGFRDLLFIYPHMISRYHISAYSQGAHGLPHSKEGRIEMSRSCPSHPISMLLRQPAVLVASTKVLTTLDPPCCASVAHGIGSDRRWWIVSQRVVLLPVPTRREDGCSPG
jgi:hypothetical protein